MENKKGFLIVDRNGKKFYILNESDIAYFDDNERMAYTVDGEAYSYDEFGYIPQIPQKKSKEEK